MERSQHPESKGGKGRERGGHKAPTPSKYTIAPSAKCAGTGAESRERTRAGRGQQADACFSTSQFIYCDAMSAHSSSQSLNWEWIWPRSPVHTIVQRPNSKITRAGGCPRPMHADHKGAELVARWHSTRTSHILQITQARIPHEVKSAGQQPPLGDVQQQRHPHAQLPPQPPAANIMRRLTDILLRKNLTIHRGACGHATVAPIRLEPCP